MQTILFFIKKFSIQSYGVIVDFVDIYHAFYNFKKIIHWFFKVYIKKLKTRSKKWMISLDIFFSLLFMLLSKSNLQNCEVDEQNEEELEKLSGH